MNAGVVIVGAGHSGAQAAIALRQRGFSGPITVVGEEREFPYERPPLSKDYLAGKRAWDRMLIRPPAFWNGREIALVPGARVEEVDAVAGRVRCSNGRALPYDQLIWAAGGRPRKLACPGGDLPGAHAIRDRADVDALRADLAWARTAVVVGGGYVGLEAAAVLRQRGLEVTVVEQQDRLLSRVAGGAVADAFLAEHRRQGVRVLLDGRVEALEEVGGRVGAVILAGGERLAAELVVVGIGIVPAVGPLVAAGAEGSDGVDVDASGRTSLPGVWAVGDCAAFVSRWGDGRRVRIESVANANDGANRAADAITGLDPSPEQVPWFWSNQYDVKLQTIGLNHGQTDAVLRGRPGTGGFSVIYLRAGRVAALDCVNATKDYVQGRALIGRSVDPAGLADPSVPLKDLAG